MAHVVVPDEEEGRFRCILELGIGEAPHYPPALPGAPYRTPLQMFAAEVASYLSDAVNRDAFSEFVLVAPHKVAHAIRVALAPSVLARLSETLAWEHVALEDDAVAAHLAPWWSSPLSHAARQGV
jgi:hypothetical protein